MKNSTHYRRESSEPTGLFKKSVGYTTDTSSGACQILLWEEFHSRDSQIPARHSSINDLASKWEQDEDFRKELEKARHWVADTFYGQEKDTIRTMRLRKGLSQSKLADILGTSQSHVARIENGYADILFDTCRKLCHALEIDMNKLNEAMIQQEKIIDTRKNMKKRK
jgi:ribosome-binding protein aMBF1 (putative translation factor)